MLSKEIEGIIVDEQCQDCIVSQTVPYFLSCLPHETFLVFSRFFIPLSLWEPNIVGEGLHRSHGAGIV